MNILTLDPADPAVAEAIAECKVGEKKSLNVTGNVTRMDDKFEMAVEGAEYAEGGEKEEAYEKPMKGGMEGGKPKNPALMILIGKGGK